MKDCFISWIVVPICRYCFHGELRAELQRISVLHNHSQDILVSSLKPQDGTNLVERSWRWHIYYWHWFWLGWMVSMLFSEELFMVWTPCMRSRGEPEPTMANRGKRSSLLIQGRYPGPSGIGMRKLNLNNYTYWLSSLLKPVLQQCQSAYQVA